MSLKVKSRGKPSDVLHFQAVLLLDLEFEFDAEELASIASHRGKESASEADVRSFVREAINKALRDAIVEYKALPNDPSANVGP